jgi:hypothetical protein
VIGARALPNHGPQLLVRQRLAPEGAWSQGWAHDWATGTLGPPMHGINRHDHLGARALGEEHHEVLGSSIQCSMRDVGWLGVLLVERNEGER